jgi:hypothetical protein
MIFKNQITGKQTYKIIYNKILFSFPGGFSMIMGSGGSGVLRWVPAWVLAKF